MFFGLSRNLFSMLSRLFCLRWNIFCSGFVFSGLFSVMGLCFLRLFFFLIFFFFFLRFKVGLSPMEYVLFWVFVFWVAVLGLCFLRF